MFSLLLAVLSRDYDRGGGGTLIPLKDYSYKGEHDKLEAEYVILGEGGGGGSRGLY